MNNKLKKDVLNLIKEKDKSDLKKLTVDYEEIYKNYPTLFFFCTSKNEYDNKKEIDQILKMIDLKYSISTGEKDFVQEHNKLIKELDNEFIPDHIRKKYNPPS